MTSRGILVYARNNSQVDYIKQAYFLAVRVKDYLGLPTTLVTDSAEFLDLEYPNWRLVFEKVIRVVWDSENSQEDTVLSRNETHAQKKFYDGSLVSKQLEWKNNLRSSAYDVSAYEETLVLDSDIVICNNNFAKCFEQKHDFLIYRDAVDLAGIDTGDDFRRISDTSVDFFWATAFFFRKTLDNKVFFDLLKHIEENWTHYKRIFQINAPYFRNDHAFSIAIHIMNGYQTSDFANPMPGTLYFVTDKSILWEINQDSLLILLEKPKYVGEYTPLRINKSTTHVMNKFSLNRCIDEI